MKSKTITEIRELMRDDDLTEEDLSGLRKDERKGVQRLLKQNDRNHQKKVELQEQFEQMLAFERAANQMGKHAIAGIDEAGRGPLAGPVVAAAVVLPDDFYLAGLNDSKQIPLAKREQFFTIIQQEADCGIGIVSNQEIDRLNIYQATKLAMIKAVDNLKQNPDHLLIDAMELDKLAFTQQSLVKGDQRSVSVAAASIVAKVTRDHRMEELHRKYPMYHFRSNQGYGTKNHMEALKNHGPSPHHRYSFAPVKEYLHE